MPQTPMTTTMTPHATPVPNLPLRDIHLPMDIGYWPPAPGWWLLLGLLVFCVLGLLLWVRFRRRRRLRRIALRQLNQLQPLSGGELATALSRLLRQAAISHYPRHEVAGLNGPSWLEFLDRPFADSPFSQGVGKCLADAPYCPDAVIEGPPLIDLCRKWLRQLPPRSQSFGRGR